MIIKYTQKLFWFVWFDLVKKEKKMQASSVIYTTNPVLSLLSSHAMKWDKWQIKKRSLKLNVTKIIAVLLSQQYSK